MGRTQRYNRIEPYRPPASGRSDPVKPRSHAKPDAELQELQAVDVDGVAATTVGTIVWAAAFLILLPFRADLQANGRGDWLWICLAGIVGGLYGIVYCRRRRASMARARGVHRRTADR
ncbi:MAG TPA: DUF2530 domain-containing protein [Actinomycetes bacterium]|nr:DUF2530 domain-containing protein [Actinomycetes bacterium]